MRRFLGIALWMIGCAICIAPAVAFWQSRDSGYNVSVGAAPPSFTGPGDVVSGALAWWGFRAYNSAYAAGHGNIADVCAAGGAGCITLTANTDGTVTNPGATACGGGACTVISKLYDQSGANSCAAAACDLVQATNGNRPAITNSLLNAMPGITCAGSPHLIVSSGSLSGTTFSVSYVARQTTSGSIVTAVGSNPMISGFDGTNTAMLFDGSVATVASVADNSFHRFQAVYNGASSSLDVDGATTSSLSPGASGLGLNSICGRSDNNFYLIGDVVEGGIWATLFNGTQQSNMDSNQKTFWGLP